MTQNPKRYLIIGLILVTIIPTTAYAVSYNGWDCNDGWATKAAVCYLGEIFEQNKQLIQQQNQTNHLLAKLYCSESDNYISQGWSGCMNKVLGETK